MAVSSKDRIPFLPDIQGLLSNVLRGITSPYTKQRGVKQIETSVDTAC
jgi:hypothetical protein